MVKRNFVVEHTKLRDVLSSNYIVPDYQRSYVWKIEDVEDLWNDLMDTYPNNTNQEEYLLGQLVTQSKGNRHEIVDGQQRLITLTLLFCAIRSILKKYNTTSNTDIDDLIYKINDLIFRDRNILIELNDNKRIIFNSIQRDDIEITKKNKISILIKNFNFLKVQVENLCFDCGFKSDIIDFKTPIRKLNKIIDDLISKTTFISVEIQNDNYTHQVFQTLNSKGLPLYQADLIKSYLLKLDNFKGDFHSEWKTVLDYDKKQDNFLYASLLSRKSKSKIQKKNLFKNIKKELDESKDIGRYLHDLQEDSEIIRLLYDPTKIPGGYPIEIKHAFYSLKQLKATYITRPIITACREWGIKDKRTKDLLNCLVTFFFMYRTICEQNIDTLKRISSEITRRIMVKKDTNLDIIFWYILKNSNLKNNPNYVDPVDFSKKFKSKTYNFNQGEKTYILRSFEYHLQKLGGVPINTNELEIEHIFPQTPNEDYWPNYSKLSEHTDRLGNLTLLPNDWNPPVGNKGFDEKKTGISKDGKKKKACYENSGLELNKKYLNNYDKWTVSEIEDRENKLCELADKIWDLSSYLKRAKEPSDDDK